MSALEPNKNYTKDGILIVVGDKTYPLLKTSSKMAFYMCEDKVKRVKIEKVVGAVYG